MPWSCSVHNAGHLSSLDLVGEAQEEKPGKSLAPVQDESVETASGIDNESEAEATGQLIQGQREAKRRLYALPPDTPFHLCCSQKVPTVKVSLPRSIKAIRTVS